MVLQIRRGIEDSRTGVIPSAGELVATTDTVELFLGDGVESGGYFVGPVTGINQLGDVDIVTIAPSTDISMLRWNGLAFAPIDHYLDAMANVFVATVSDGQGLVYDTPSTGWINTDALTLTLTSLASGQGLYYNEDDAKFTNQPPVTQVEGQVLKNGLSNVGWDALSGTFAQLQLIQDYELTEIVNSENGHKYSLLTIQQGASTGHIIFTGNNWFWPGGSPPVITQGSNRRDLIEITRNNGVYYGRFVGSQDFLLG
jgi:hypothetical protein